MQISEIFYSLQGEGTLVGVPSIFIRLAGCPLRCRWCDTKYAWDENAGAKFTLEEIIPEIQKWSCRFVVITGGEPMINSELPQLAGRLKALGKHITIETAGIAYYPGLPCDLMSISPKLSNSTPEDSRVAAEHENSRLDFAVLGELIDNYNYQLKFVVESETDMSEIHDTIGRLGNVDPSKVLLMPQAATREKLIEKAPIVAELCKQTGFTFCHRLQIMLWNNQKGT